MDKLYEKSETGCCPRFDPQPWTDTEVEWKDKLFLKDRVRTFLHIPLNFGQVVVGDMKKIKEAGALADKPLMLYDGKSAWASDVYIAVGKEVAGAEMAKISGKFMAKVFEGPFSSTGKWVSEMTEYVKAKGREMKKLYFFYTTCPACAKYYGKNYVVVLAKI